MSSAAALAATVQPGSDFHYASFYFPPATRATLVLLESLRREIVRIPESCSDRGVAHIKLAWWREEFTCNPDAQPRHELSRALRATAPQVVPAYASLVDAVDASLSSGLFAHREAVVAAIRNSLDAITLAMISSSGDPPTASVCELLQQLAAQTELAYALRDLRHHRRAGAIYLSSTSFEAHGLTIDDIRHGDLQERQRELLHEEFQLLRATLQTLLGTLTGAERRRQRLFTSLARMQIAALRLALEDDCRVLERRQELTPVHKLMLAWRTRWFG